MATGCMSRFSSSRPLSLFPTDVFPILTSPHRLTPERFHDFLSLSTSPPLPYNHNLHQIHHDQERPTTTTEKLIKVETDRSQSNGGPPTSDTPSAPSFAQVGKKERVLCYWFPIPSPQAMKAVVEDGEQSCTLFVLQALQGKPPPVWPIKSTSSSRGVHRGGGRKYCMHMT